MSNTQCVVLKPSANPDEPGFEVKKSPIPEAEGDDVVIKVIACGVCYSDSYTVLGGMNAIFPGVPGHEVVGRVVKAGPGSVAQTFAEGTVVGAGWYGGHCQACEACAHGDFICCEKGVVTGIHRHGGYQEGVLRGLFSRGDEESKNIARAARMAG